MDVDKINLNHLEAEINACNREGFNPQQYQLIKGRLQCAMMTLNRYNSEKWTPQIFNSFNTNSPSQMKSFLSALLPLSDEEKDHIKDTELKIWFENLCELLEEKVLIYMIHNRAVTLYETAYIHPREREITALKFLDKYKDNRTISYFEIASDITGKNIETLDELVSVLDHQKVQNAIKKVLSNSEKAKRVDTWLSNRQPETFKYANERLLDALYTGLKCLFLEANLFITIEQCLAKGEQPPKKWINKELTRIGTAARQESVKRLESVKQGIPPGTKKKPKPLIDGRVTSKEDFYKQLYSKIHLREETVAATKLFIAKQLRLWNEGELNSMLRFYEDERTWKQIRDYATKKSSE